MKKTPDTPVSEASKNPDDFLVVENPEQTTTFHLQVMTDGKPDHRLMGAAHAALMSPNGYRGQKYAGPDKAKAIQKLKALYKKEDMPWPSAEKAAENEPLAEDMHGFVPAGVTSFADLEAAEQVYESIEEMQQRVSQFQQIVANIFYSPDITDKLGALRALVDEFTALMGGAAGSVYGSEAELSEAATIKAKAKGVIRALAGLLEDKALPDSLRKQIDGLNEALRKNWKDLEAEAEEEWGKGKSEESCKLTESDGGAVGPVELCEAGSEATGIVRMKVRLIKPGWGNTKDNHFYGAEMLKAHAAAFKNAHMYETDHKQAEKSTRTWVSTVTDVAPAEDGSLIADVVVHDPGFAQRARNLSEAGLLEQLPCSILADGNYRPNYEADGRKGKYIESITKVDSVDWVTRAGAGGQALTIAESEEGMGDTPQTTQGAATVPVETPPVTTPAPVTETAAPVAPPAAPPAPVKLAESAVRSTLEKSRLPKASQERLALAEYADAAALETAVAAEIAYVKELTASGKPFLMGESTAPETTKLSEADLQKRFDEIDRRHGIVRP